MPTPALLLIIATLLPLLSFLLLVFLGKRLGNPLAGYVGVVAIGAGFVCSLAAMMVWMGDSHGTHAWGMGRGAINLPLKWIPIATPAANNGVAQDHPGFLDIGVYVDSLTIVMFCMITLVATLIHVFSIGYMREDKRFPRFFTYLGLFCFSMLGLVLGGTILQLFIFWELVGLCSYLLIGFWYEKKSASNAAIKAFVTNRVGDFGFLIGFGILFYHLGNVTLPNLWVVLGDAGKGGAIALSNGMTFTPMLLTLMGIGLFFGAMGKSAQFPLHVWLPDAMEGPTPVSALIHAATMVAAGVYLVGRIFPILTPDAKLFIAIIGLITLAMAALIAIAQSDIKKVLAYSTLSQLGYMILAMGIGSWVGGLFHLITHAFFKALLFLGAGSVIDAAHHKQELSQYGGLWRKIPMTAITFGIAVFAIAGLGYGGLGFSGHVSKDMVLRHAGAFVNLALAQGKSPWYRVFFIVPTIIAYVTAFYMTRCWMLTFWGKPRDKEVYEHAREMPVMWVPLVVLAVFSIIGGNILGIRDLLENAVKESNATCTAQLQKLASGQAFYANKTFKGFQSMWPAESPGESAEPHPQSEWTPSEFAHEHGQEWVEIWVQWAFVIGIGLGFLIYRKGYAIADKLYAIAPLRWIHIWLYRRMYFDELYFAIFVGTVRALSAISAVFDKVVIDGLVNGVARLVKQLAMAAGWHDKHVVDGAVDGAGRLAQGIGYAVRIPQTGRVRNYVTALMAAVALALAVGIIVVLSR